MRNSLLSLLLAAACIAPASAVTISLTPLVVGQNSLPTLVTTCASPNVPASIAGDAYYQMPTIAMEQGVSGTSQIAISLSDTGKLLSHRVFASSGNSWLDQAALKSVRLTRFSPEMQNCRRVGGTYLYAVDY